MTYLNDRRRGVIIALAAVCLAFTITAWSQGVFAGAAAVTHPSCLSGPPPKQRATQTTISTIGQAYWCILEHYYDGPILQDQVLLDAAFAGFTQQLERSGFDESDATLPAFDGDRSHDWDAFAAVYQRVESELPANQTLRQALASATMQGMVASLQDDHAAWFRPAPAASGTQDDVYGLGFQTTVMAPLAILAQAEALTPLYVTAVVGGPAAHDRLRAGDVIVSVNGSAPFVDGQVSVGVIDLLYQSYPQHEPLRITFHRPATGRTWTVRMTPTWFPQPAIALQPVSAKLVDGDIAYVKLSQFAGGAAQTVLHAISTLGGAVKLRGVILDLRNNGGGVPPEVTALLGAFVHNAVYGYECNYRGGCIVDHVGGTVPLVHLPLVLLTSRNCASGCEVFSSAIKDLHLGVVVGTRTAGIVAGPAYGYFLNDGSRLLLPLRHQFAADHERIDGIGVAPDYYIPLTADELSTGQDPDLAKAISLLDH